MTYHLFAQSVAGLAPDPDAIGDAMPSELNAELSVCYGPGHMVLLIDGLQPLGPCTLTLLTDPDGVILAAGPLMMPTGPGTAAPLPDSDNLRKLYAFLLTILEDACEPPIDFDADGFEGTRWDMEC